MTPAEKAKLKEEIDGLVAKYEGMIKEVGDERRHETALEETRKKIEAVSAETVKIVEMGKEVDRQNKEAIENAQKTLKLIDEQEIEYQALKEIKQNFIIPLDRYHGDLGRLKEKYRGELEETETQAQYRLSHLKDRFKELKGKTEFLNNEKGM